jgi:DNA repair protein RadA
MNKDDMSNTKKYFQIDDLPSMSKSIIKTLHKLGLNTIESLAMSNIEELIEAGILKKDAEKIVNEARSSTSLSFIRVDELAKKEKTLKRLTSGSKKLDNLLNGGLETETITEFYGEYGSGKSQIAHQLCVNVQLPINRGGLDGAALYLDTENTFRTERIAQMAEHLGLNPKKIFQKIILAKAYNSDHQIFLLENSDDIIKKNNVKLIIVDSLTAHFRSEYIGREKLALRQQKLNRHMHKLIRLAVAFNAVAAVTNQVLASPDSFFGNPVQPIGGHIVAHTSHTRIYLRKAKGITVRICRLVSSPYLPEGECIFRITGNGIEDIEQG